MSTRELVLVSACLVGLQTRYDDGVSSSPHCLERLEDSVWIPICPEQLGGLPTPREPADIVGGTGEDVLNGTARVVDKQGKDITRPFIRGAHQVLRIALSQNVSSVLLKARSPSCGILKLGVTAALLKKHGFTLEEFDSLKPASGPGKTG